jgi:hypothetical protein
MNEVIKNKARKDREMNKRKKKEKKPSIQNEMNATKTINLIQKKI